MRFDVRSATDRWPAAVRPWSLARRSGIAHAEAADYWSQWRLRLGIPSVVIAAAVAAVTTMPFPGHYYVAAIASATVAALTALLTFLNPAERAGAHRQASRQYQELSRRLEMLINQVVQSRARTDPTDDQTNQLNDLERQVIQTLQGSPDLPPTINRKFMEGKNTRSESAP